MSKKAFRLIAVILIPGLCMDSTFTFAVSDSVSRQPADHFRSTFFLRLREEALAPAGAAAYPGNTRSNFSIAGITNLVEGMREVLAAETAALSRHSSEQSEISERIVKNYLLTKKPALLMQIINSLERESNRNPPYNSNDRHVLSTRSNPHLEIEMQNRIRALYENLYPGGAADIEASGRSVAFLASEVLSGESRLSLFEPGRMPALAQVAYDYYGGPTDVKTFLSFLNGLQCILDIRSAFEKNPIAAEFIAHVARYKALLKYEEFMRRPGAATPWPSRSVGGDYIDLASGEYVADLMPLLDATAHYTVVEINPFVAEYLLELSGLCNIPNLTVLRLDLLRMERPSRPVTQIRAMNVFSYVNQAAPKLVEMLDWLAPGGQLILGGYVGQPQTKERTLQDFGAVIRAKLQRGWTLSYQSSRDGIFDTLFLTKPLNNVAIGSDDSSERALKRFLQDAEAWNSPMDQLLRELAAREGVTLENDARVGLFIGDPTSTNRNDFKLFEYILRELFQGLVHLVYLPLLMDAEGADVTDRSAMIKTILRHNVHVIGAVISAPWQEHFQDVSPLNEKLGTINYLIKTAPGQLEGVAFSVLDSLEDHDSMIEGLVRIIRGWVEQILPDLIKPDFSSRVRHLVLSYLEQSPTAVRNRRLMGSDA